MSALPEFSFDHIVTALSGKNDKITLAVEHGIYTGTAESLDAFRNFCSGPRRGESSLAGNWYSRIFKSGGFRRELEIRKSRQGAPAAFPIPLFGGKYRLRQYRDTVDPDDELRVPATLHLLLNPTRFLRYQDTARYFPPRWSLAARRRTAPRYAATFFQERIVPETEEIALDGKDNYIPDTDEFQFAHDGRLWRRNLRAYVDGVLRTIEEDTARAEQLENVPACRVPSPETNRPFNLTNVETYFEFRFPNPLQLVNDIGPLVRSFNELRSSVDHYQSRPLLSETWEKNSLVFTKRFEPGVKFKMYAKTNHRIRVEVVHDLTKANFQHKLPTLNGVYELLEELRGEAAKVVNEMFNHLKGRASVRPTPLTSMDLLFDIANVLRSHQNARTLIDILCNKGSISTLKPFTGALGRLKRAGILKPQRRNQKQEYVVTAKYEHPLKMLQRYGNVTHLTTRHRKRAVSA